MMTLIIGGAGSGKSAFAEELVMRLPGKRIYLATLSATDGESLRRIARHRTLREGKGFATLERPTNLSALSAEALFELELSDAGRLFQGSSGAARSDAHTPVGINLLLEDLSNLLANELYGPDGGGTESVRQGLRHLCTVCGSLTIVTNEVFSAGIRYDAEMRRYLRELALLNRQLAAEANLVVEVVCGLPNVLKGDLP